MMQLKLLQLSLDLLVQPCTSSSSLFTEVFYRLCQGLWTLASQMHILYSQRDSQRPNVEATNNPGLTALADIAL